MNIANNLAFVLLTMVAFKETAASKVRIGGDILFKSEKELRVTYLKRGKDKDGKCVQKIKVTYPEGGTHGDVSAKCMDNYREKSDGNEYIVGKVLLSEKPDSFFVLTPNNECNVYTIFGGGKVSGPEKPKAAKCDQVKEKLKQFDKENNGITDNMADTCGTVWEYAQYLNPYTLSSMEMVMKMMNKFMKL